MPSQTGAAESSNGAPTHCTPCSGLDLSQHAYGTLLVGSGCRCCAPTAERDTGLDTSHTGLTLRVSAPHQFISGRVVLPHVCSAAVVDRPCEAILGCTSCQWRLESVTGRQTPRLSARGTSNTGHCCHTRFTVEQNSARHVPQGATRLPSAPSHHPHVAVGARVRICHSAGDVRSSTDVYVWWSAASAARNALTMTPKTRPRAEIDAMRVYQCWACFHVREVYQNVKGRL